MANASVFLRNPTFTNGSFHHYVAEDHGVDAPLVLENREESVGPGARDRFAAPEAVPKFALRREVWPGVRTIQRKDRRLEE